MPHMRWMTGFHVHAAEDELDVRLTMERYGRRIMDRFLDFGIPGAKTIFVHGVHFEARELDLLRSTDSMLVNNPGIEHEQWPQRSAHSGYAKTRRDGGRRHRRYVLAPDLPGPRDVPAPAYPSPRPDPGLSAEACEILLHNNRTICNRLFPEPRGTLAAGQLADIMIPDYVPFTPLNAETFYRAPVLFGLSFARVRTTIALGRVIVENGLLPQLDEETIRAHCVERAERIWARIT